MQINIIFHLTIRCSGHTIDANFFWLAPKKTKNRNLKRAKNRKITHKKIHLKRNKN